MITQYLLTVQLQFDGVKDLRSTQRFSHHPIFTTLFLSTNVWNRDRLWNWDLNTKLGNRAILESVHPKFMLRMMLNHWAFRTVWRINGVYCACKSLLIRNNKLVWNMSLTLVLLLSDVSIDTGCCSTSGVSVVLQPSATNNNFPTANHTENIL